MDVGTKEGVKIFCKRLEGCRESLGTDALTMEINIWLANGYKIIDRQQSFALDEGGFHPILVITYFYQETTTRETIDLVK